VTDSRGVMTEQPPHAPEPEPQQPSPDVAMPALRVGDALPARLYSDDLMRIFGIAKSRFYVLQARGAFDRFQLKPTIGRRAWSGKLVQAYLDGEAPAVKRPGTLRVVSGGKR